MKMFHSGQDFESAAWFSSGQDLVLWSGQQVSILVGQKFRSVQYLFNAITRTSIREVSKRGLALV